jgi:alcohol dehydrogenase (cytochrome c)
MRTGLLIAALFAAAPVLAGEPAADRSWPTFHGDLTGRHHSDLKQIDSGNVGTLRLAWVYKAQVPAESFGLKPAIKATPVEQDGVLYFSMPNRVWAVDARTGREIWTYVTKSGTSIGNRGVAVHNGMVYLETPDSHLVALEAATGHEKWRVEIADSRLGYVSTMAPTVMKNQLMVAAGGDSLDLPGYLQARDPETGALKWEWRVTPKPGEKGSETWPDAQSMDHGGGMPWLPGTYDSELNLIYWGTGNPNPVHAGQGRKGDDLYTCTIVALDADTGKLVWHYQVSPHDTHDWDAVQTPVLFDGNFAGKPRKLLIQASRNGYFFVLDRKTGEHLLTEPYAKVSWAKGLDAQGRPIPDPDKEPRTDGTLVNPTSGGAANWPAQAFDPDSGLLFVPSVESYSIYYLTDTGPKPVGFGGRDDLLEPQPAITAIDYTTGKIRWQHPFSPGIGFSGLLSTAGRLVFGGDTDHDFLALDAADGHSLWHVNLGEGMTNAPITYSIGGRQYVVVAAGLDLYGFTLSEKR